MITPGLLRSTLLLGNDAHALQDQLPGLRVQHFDATGRFLSIHGRDGVLRVWEIGRPAPLIELPGGGSEEFMPDGKEMLVRGPGPRTFFYSLTTGKETRHWDCPDASHLQARVSPDGSQVVLSSLANQSSFIICRTDTGEQICSLLVMPAQIGLTWMLT